VETGIRVGGLRAYVMNKMAMGSPGPIVTALVERLYHIVNC
jgi:hypothetical protein